MYINITDSETGSNKGSCGKLVDYLEKENRTLRNNHQPEMWFNNTRQDIFPQEVRVNIDNNIAKLGKNDAKFYLVNISPSQKEIAHLQELFGKQGAEQKLKEFAESVMDGYARNFKRTGINSGHDLLWYGKLERNRYYSVKDKEVKEGLKKRGERKEGEQMHIQVIVSRKDITNKIKLSPLNNSRGTNQQHSAKMGQFDRKAFKASGEQFFDQAFNFDRSLKDTMAYALTMKKGSGEQKRMLHVLGLAETRLSDDNKKIAFEIARGNVQDQHQEQDQSQGLEQLLKTGSSLASEILDILLSPVPMSNGQTQSITPGTKKKKKKRGYPGWTDGI